MKIVKNRKIFYIISTIVVLVSIVSLFVFGLNYGIDFKGGSIIEVVYPIERPEINEVEASLSLAEFKGFSIRASGETDLIVRTAHLSEEEKSFLMGALSGGGKWPLEQKRFSSVGPTLGAELKSKALLSILLVIIAIILFIAFAFRKVSEPISSWKYGLMAIVGLIHNVIIPTGVFAILGHYLGVEVDALFVTALLVVLGFSVHDTIVVFDRVRENLKKNKEYNKKEPFEETVGKSVSQTIARSINTSLTTIITLVALYIWGSESTKWFSLALLIGITVGTYSSICLASPLLVTIEERQRKKLGSRK